MFHPLAIVIVLITMARGLMPLTWKGASVQTRTLQISQCNLW